MENRYTHLVIEERCELARLQAGGHSIRQIAASLDRAPSSVARELKRNRSTNGRYLPSYAHQQAWAHRWVVHASTAIAVGVTRSCLGSRKVGHLSRFRAALPTSEGGR